MQREQITPRPADSQDYAALRQTGTSSRRARLVLGLESDRARRFENLFRKRAARGAGDRQLPKFARNEAHVAAVLAAGGFWALSERRIGKAGMVVCLPMLPPPPAR